MMVDQLESQVPELTYLLALFLQKYGWTDRDTIVKSFGKPRTTIYDHLNRLKMLGLLRTRRLWKDSRGRPVIEFNLAEASR